MRLRRNQTIWYNNRSLYELAKDWGIFLAKIMKVLTAVILLIPHFSRVQRFFYGIKKIMISNLKLKPVCYQVPIRFGHSGEYFTYYITKGYPDFIKPLDTDFEKKVGVTNPLDKWFVTWDRFEQIRQDHCYYRNSNHHMICPLPEQADGFDSPELALQALQKHFELTGKEYVLL